MAVNYKKENCKILTELVKSLPVTYQERIPWHKPFIAVQNIFENGGKDVPKELLSYMYENTLCSFCRESILKQMGKRRMLTQELFTECLHDCNKYIQTYARKMAHAFTR